MLHSWGSAMTHHPHVHMIVPGGGLCDKGERWIACRPTFFLPVRVLSRLFRRLFLEMLATAHEADRLQFFGDHAALAGRAIFAAFLAPLRKVECLRRQKPRGVRRTAAFLGFLIVLTAMIALPVSPARGGESIWTHNGSTVRWVSSGEDRWLYYLQPRPGLAAMGVEADTLLFEGRRVGNRLFGTAYVFSENCPPTPYAVEGIIYSETDVRLYGAVPVVDPYSCDVVDYTWDSYNAALRFHYVMTIDHAQLWLAVRAKKCLAVCHTARLFLLSLCYFRASALRTLR